MIIFPAIDLKGGACVRLQQGDFATSTVYRSDPVTVAKEYEQAGATWLHIIDLDGAETGVLQNTSIVSKILTETSLNVQLGGGIRTKDQIISLLELGVNRVIVGTFALREPETMQELIQKYPTQIVVSVDSLNGFVTYHGWQESSTKTTIQFCKELEEYGVQTIVYTDISKDGMMEGPNFSDYQSISDNTSLDVIASGGVSTINDVQKLQNMKLYGAIIGKALYIKNIDLKEAISCSQDVSSLV